MTLSVYRARHSPPPRHTVTSSHCCLVPWAKTQCCSIFFCGPPPSSFVLPRLLLPSGTHVSIVLGCLLVSILRTWPMNFQRCLTICSLMILMLARLEISLFDILIGQYIFISLLRLLCRNTSCLVASLLVMRHVSQLYNRLAITLDLKIFSLVSNFS